MLLGKEASAKTSTACSASTSPNQPTSPTFPKSSLTLSPGNSIPGQDKHWDGKLLPSCSYQRGPPIWKSTGNTSATLAEAQRPIEKWKANCASHFPTAPAAGVL